MMPIRASDNDRCPCGSGQIAYNLRNNKGELLMYCCFKCEKTRRANGANEQKVVMDKQIPDAGNLESPLADI